MYSATCLRRGVDHKHFCEDALFLDHQDPLFVGAVFDGCSSGHRSHFASELSAKLMRHCLRQKPIQSIDAHEELLAGFLSALAQAQSLWQLPAIELLSTCLSFVYDSEKEILSIVNFGDGAYFVNSQSHVIDQQNEPDYPCYHLQNSKQDWLKHIKNQQVIYEGVKRFGLFSDGVLSFRHTQPSQELELDPFAFLQQITAFEKNPKQLERKLNLLASQYSCEHRDDISGIVIAKEYDLPN